MGTHLPEDCYTLEKSKEKEAEYIKERKAQDLEKKYIPPRRSQRYKKQG